MMSKKIDGHTISEIKGGIGMGSFIQPVCSCGWVGREHYAYCNYQYSNYCDNIDEHFVEVRTDEYLKEQKGI